MKKILIIDDDTVFADTLTEMLSLNDYEVSRAKNGEEGLEQIDATHPDLVVLDILMPKLSGIGLLKKLKERDGKITIPILVSSNLDSMEEISAALSLGARGYIVKSDQSLESIVSTIGATLKESK